MTYAARKRAAKSKLFLVEIVSRHRLPETLDFLAQALQHANTEIWKNALDGIVAIGGDEGLIVLEAEQHRLRAVSSSDKALRLEWINEAMEQLS